MCVCVYKHLQRLRLRHVSLTHLSHTYSLSLSLTHRIMAMNFIDDSDSSSSSSSSEDSARLSDYNSEAELDLQIGPIVQGADSNFDDVLFHTYQFCRDMNTLTFKNSQRIRDMLAILKCLKRLAEINEIWSKSPTLQRVDDKTKLWMKAHPGQSYAVAFYNVIRDTLPSKVYNLFDSMHHHEDD